MTVPIATNVDPTLRRDQFYHQVGTRIREGREKRAMTQEALAKIIGLSRTSLTNIERGRQRILLHTLSEIATALGMNANELFPAPENDVQVIRLTLQSQISTLPQPQQDFVQRTLGPVIDHENSKGKSNSSKSKPLTRALRDKRGSRKR